MGIANLRALKEKERAKEGTVTIICKNCTKPLWSVEVMGTYGTRFVTKETPFPNVPPYEMYFSRNMECKRDDCPFCGECWFDLIMDERQGSKIAKPRILEFE